MNIPMQRTSTAARVEQVRRIISGRNTQISRPPYGRQAVRDREAALALGVRVAVHDSRQNDPGTRVIWQAGQDHRAADAIHAARHQPARTRLGPERVGVER